MGKKILFLIKSERNQRYGILSLAAFLKEKGQKILYDLRSSNIVKEHIESSGGKAIISSVGHSYIKQIMRETDIVFCGSLVSISIN